MTAAQEHKAYAYGRDREFTKEEYDALASEINAAIERGDNETMKRLLKNFPMEPDIMMAFGSVLGRSFIIDGGFDLTQANMRFGEGWLDELKAGKGKDSPAVRALRSLAKA